MRLIHQLDRRVGRQADRAVGEIVDETRLDRAQVGRHRFELLRRLARAQALSNSTVPWGLKSSAFWVLPSRLPLTSTVLPAAVVRMPELLTDKPPWMIERAGILNAQIPLDRPACRPGRCSCPP